MKIVIAPDSFKNCLRSPLVCRHLASGLREGLPDARIVELPLADGGEGTVDAVAAAGIGRRVRLPLHGPDGRAVAAEALLLPDGGVVCEVAAACGLELIAAECRNPLRLSSAGVGEMLRQLTERHGVRRFVVGLGGSATIDGGAGLLQTLGAVFRDGAGRRLASPVDGGGLLRIAAAELSAAPLQLTVAADVVNPLCGPDGAAVVFGPQKGADETMIHALDAALARFARLCGADGAAPGDGAAGGLGMAFRLLGAERRSGAELMLDLTQFDRHAADADLVITGEGRTDAQSAAGKLCAAVARRARRLGVPTVLVSGALTGDADPAGGFDAMFSLADGTSSAAACIATADRRLHRMGRHLAALLRIR